MPTARFSQPSVCQHIHLKSFQQWHTADTGRCSCSLAAVDKDGGQAPSGGQRHIIVWCFLSLTKKSLLWQTVPGKSWDETYIFIVEGSSLEQAVYLIQFFLCSCTTVHLIRGHRTTWCCSCFYSTSAHRFLSWKLIAFNFRTCCSLCEYTVKSSSHFFIWKQGLPGIHLEAVSAHPCLSHITLYFKRT